MDDNLGWFNSDGYLIKTLAYIEENWADSAKGFLKVMSGADASDTDDMYDILLNLTTSVGDLESLDVDGDLIRIPSQDVLEVLSAYQNEYTYAIIASQNYEIVDDSGALDDEDPIYYSPIQISSSFQPQLGESYLKGKVGINLINTFEGLEDAVSNGGFFISNGT